MAKLNPNLIFSMISDLNELHNIGREMMCIERNCEMVSWKYPDKLIKDIDIDTCTLVETWDKYVLLLELIIDRLYQVMCVSTTIMDSLPQLSNTFKLPKNIQRTSSVSLGSVVSFFWKRLQILMIPTNLLSRSSISTEKTNEGTNIANCESCHFARKTVKKLISTLEDCMKENTLPSKITEQRTILEKEIFELSQSEAMDQWTNAIQLDVKKLTTFSNRNSLKVKDYKKELDLMRVSNDRNAEILRSTQRKYTDLEKHYNDDKNKNRDLIDSNNTLELKYNKITADLKSSTDACTKVEAKFQELQNILNQTMADNETTITNLKSEYVKQITRISSEKDQWIEISGKRKQQIDELETRLKLQWEKQTEAERKLRQDLDNEKQKVTEEKLKVEKEHGKLLEKLEEQIDENTKIFALTEELCKAKREIEEYKAREIFLVRYPDLNGSIGQNHMNKCSMDPSQDMEQQLAANEIRIQLLHEQNVSLRRTVSKMKAIRSSANVDYSRE